MKHLQVQNSGTLGFFFLSYPGLRDIDFVTNRPGGPCFSYRRKYSRATSNTDQLQVVVVLYPLSDSLQFSVKLASS